MTEAMADQASEWEGHVHSFPKSIDPAKDYTCKECGEVHGGMFIAAARAQEK